MNSLIKLKYLTCVLSLLLFASFSLTLLYYTSYETETDRTEIVLDTEDMTDSFKPVQSKSCRFDSCFDITRCEFNHESLVKVYIYPSTEFYDGAHTHLHFNISLPYKAIISAIESSAFYTEDPSRACVFIPPIETLVDSSNDPLLTSLALSQLPFWNEGANHLIFSLLPFHPNSLPSLSTNRAVVAGAGLLYSEYRTGFDLSIPAYNFPERLTSPPPDPAVSDRDIFLLILLPLELDTSLETTLQDIQLQNPERVTTLDFCYEDQRCVEEDTVRYPDILLSSRYCLLLTGYRYATPDLLDVMMCGCVPVYSQANYMLPFEEVLDWKLIGVPVRPAFLPQVLQILDALSEDQWRRKQTHSLGIWSRYFSSLSRIALTALLVLNDRVFSVQSNSYQDWNLLERDMRRENPLLLQPTPARDAGVTAVVVSNGRVSSLTDLMRVLGEARSVKKVLIVWNSEGHIHTHVWSETGTEVRVIESEGGEKLSRFLPQEYILTDCVLSISDDVTHLTPDEIEFGYRTWRQFPDRLVGYSAASHFWNEGDMRWDVVTDIDEFSLLTDTLFYHSYYQPLLSDHTQDMEDMDPRCEDMTLNFVVSLLTKKNPIKLTQKVNQKVDGESLTEVRNKCLNTLAEYFNEIPLRRTRFRVDPFSHPVDGGGVSREQVD